MKPIIHLFQIIFVAFLSLQDMDIQLKVRRQDSYVQGAYVKVVRDRK